MAVRRNHEHSHHCKTSRLSLPSPLSLSLALPRVSSRSISLRKYPWRPASACTSLPQAGSLAIAGEEAKDRLLKQESQNRWKGGSGAWTRTRISSSKGWRATDCTTPDQVMSSLLVYLRPATGQQCPPGLQQLRSVFLPGLAADMGLPES